MFSIFRNLWVLKRVKFLNIVNLKKLVIKLSEYFIMKIIWIWRFGRYGRGYSSSSGFRSRSRFFLFGFLRFFSVSSMFLISSYFFSSFSGSVGGVVVNWRYVVGIRGSWGFRWRRFVFRFRFIVVIVFSIMFFRFLNLNDFYNKIFR